MACMECGHSFRLIYERYQYNKEVKKNIKLTVYRCPNDHIVAYANLYSPLHRPTQKVLASPPPKMTLDELRISKGMPPMTKKYIKENFITIHKGEDNGKKKRRKKA